MNYNELIKKYNLPDIYDICDYYGQIKDNLPYYILDLLALRYYEEHA